MVVCELDQEVSGEVLGWKLPAWQTLLLHRVLPSCGGLLVYLTLMCFDFALVFEHFQNGNKVIGSFCLVLITCPALISLVFSLASAPPGLQTEEGAAFSVTISKKDLKWIARQLANCFFFPVTAIGRYCYLIFWWMEAVCAAYVDDKERTMEAILRARSSSPIELYLFLQAFLHAAPHAIVNLLDMIVRFSNAEYSKVAMQAVSVIVSCMRMSSTATMYRRFEREKLNGRKYPWNKNSKALITKDVNDEKTPIIEDNNKDPDPIYETIQKQSLEFNFSIPSGDERTKANSDLIQFSPRSTQQEIYYDDIYYDSDVSSDYLPPISPSSPQSNSDDEYVRPISIIDRVAPRRPTYTQSQYTIEKVEIIPPPIIPAPRPGSLAVWAEKMVENAESLPSWLSAPHRRKYNDEVIQEEPDIPRRVPRSRMRGLEPQDATAALVHYIGWYAFFVSRLLSIAVFIKSSIIASVMILFSHYQVMLLLLIVPQASTVRRGFYIFLAFVYLFCLMEFKIRFRHVRVWHVFWIIVCTIETVVFTGVWASLDRGIHDWWKDFIVKVILASMLLSYMCFLVYFVLLKPRETIVYINNKNKDKDVNV
ncbi:uncharacterized protein LOC135087960 [Ostrinia nubilalis]|uniref:uncharacterized protein LOC135087960 n=1 Tax=Ostrinia nubilalis TaxID=29057 RepID=UPI0030822CA4